MSGAKPSERFFELLKRLEEKVEAICSKSGQREDEAKKLLCDSVRKLIHDARAFAARWSDRFKMTVHGGGDESGWSVISVEVEGLATRFWYDVNSLKMPWERVVINDVLRIFFSDGAVIYDVRARLRDGLDELVHGYAWEDRGLRELRDEVLHELWLMEQKMKKHAIPPIEAEG